jgi:hypothetical protein
MDRSYGNCKNLRSYRVRVLECTPQDLTNIINKDNAIRIVARNVDICIKAFIPESKGDL